MFDGALQGLVSQHFIHVLLPTDFFNVKGKN